MAADSADEDDDAGLFWNGPSTQNDANAYIQYVQSFWTDERIGAADPRPMPIDDNDAKSFGSGSESVLKLNQVFWPIFACCFFILYIVFLRIPF